MKLFVWNGLRLKPLYCQLTKIIWIWFWFFGNVINKKVKLNNSMLNCVILGIRHLANLTTAMPLFERKSCTYEKQSSYFHFHWVQWLECREVHNSFWCSHCATAKPTGWPIFGQTSIMPEELLLYVGFQKTLWMFRVGSFYLDPRFKIKAPRH